MAFTFEKLIVYQKAISFADSVCARTEKFPRGYGFLSDQLNRATSITICRLVHQRPIPAGRCDIDGRLPAFLAGTTSDRHRGYDHQAYGKKASPDH